MMMPLARYQNFGYLAFMLPIKTPPIKIQGIKTKLIPFIRKSFVWDANGRWIEPFMGSAVVAFNMRPARALLADTNPHLIRLYTDLQAGKIDARMVRSFLVEEGENLLLRGAEYYYDVRERFNNSPNTLDFLFLNRSCFNGVMRFNSKGRFNVPLSKIHIRFAQAYITKITNQVKWASEVISQGDYEFVLQDWEVTLRTASGNDFIYIDPPYAGRHTDYFNSWSEADADRLATSVLRLDCGFALSTWLENKYRKNEWVEKWFSEYEVSTLTHFYHVGASENLRNEMFEALIVQKGFEAVSVTPCEPTSVQLNLLSSL